MRKFTITTAITAVLFITLLFAAESNKYVGKKGCVPCHTVAKAGKQAEIWKGSKHAEAYNTLTTPKALDIAKAKGIANPAEAKECLECHTLGKTAAADLLDSKFDIKDGVQCESCHGAGSAYKNGNIMKDKAKAIEAGMTNFANAAAIESFCKHCHNDKSPTFKGFDFKEKWEKIKHPVPKG
jgi:excinuclease UvrABC ATPase subunit